MTRSWRQILNSFLKNDHLFLVAIFLFALLLRLAFLPGLLNDPAFVQPIMESQDLNRIAHDLAAADDANSTRFPPYIPGYAYFAAFIYRVLGISVLRLVIVQYLIGSLCTCLVFSLTTRLINRKAAIVAAVLMSAYWMLIYTQSHLFSENLSMLLNLVTAYLLLVAADSWKKYLICGILCGLAVLVWPPMVFFAGLLWFWLIIKKLPARMVAAYYALFLAGVSLCLIPWLMREQKVEYGTMHQILSGIRFYVGNAPEHRGTEIHLTAGRRNELMGKFFQDRGPTAFGVEPTPEEFGSYYFSEAFKFIRLHPLQWAGFMAAKLGSIAVGIDFPEPAAVYFYEKHIRAGPHALIQTWLIFILAATGILLSLKGEARKFSLPVLYLVSFVPMLFLDFKTRHTIPALPMVAIFSAYTVNFLMDRFDSAGKGEAVSLFVRIVLLFNIMAWNPLHIEWPSKSEVYYAIGGNFSRSDNFEQAELYFLKALEEDPYQIPALNDLGVVYMTTGDFELAAKTFQRALETARHPLLLANLQMTIRLLAEGGPYDRWETTPQEERERIQRYYAHFPYPYHGPASRTR